MVLGGTWKALSAVLGALVVEAVGAGFLGAHVDQFMGAPQLPLQLVFGASSVVSSAGWFSRDKYDFPKSWKIFAAMGRSSYPKDQRLDPPMVSGEWTCIVGVGNSKLAQFRGVWKNTLPGPPRNFRSVVFLQVFRHHTRKIPFLSCNVFFKQYEVAAFKTLGWHSILLIDP